CARQSCIVSRFLQPGKARPGRLTGDAASFTLAFIQNNSREEAHNEDRGEPSANTAASDTGRGRLDRRATCRAAGFRIDLLWRAPDPPSRPARQERTCRW